ncbi:SPOCS domain-containing protein [Phosphitispora sp. TUW77]|uniref:SPOCS domain-containing protein n=1 Tax=Phosphitispora sp. TUW77 TaxID=3152361 RepID=UPI003AB7CDB0
MNFIDKCLPCEIEECCPVNAEDVAYYTEVIIDGELHIPEQKPPKEKIINVTHKILINKVKSIPVQLDNGCVTGCKILVCGIVRLGIEYSADVPEQNVHYVHFDIPFQGLIVGDSCHKPIPLKDCNLSKFNFHACMEHVQVHQAGPRTMEKVIVLLLWLERKHYGKKSTYKKPPKDECFIPPYKQPPDTSKQISVNHTLTIPEEKPDAECILKSDIEIVIKKAEVISTSLQTKCCHVPIKKVIIAGKAVITLKYVADVPDQQVHATVFKVPFEALIEWPNGPPQNTPVNVGVVIEHFNVELMDKRRLFKVLLLRLEVFKC